MKLPDGRILYVEVPGRLTTPDRSGEVAFLPAGARFLDRVRAVAMQSVGSPSPGHLTTLREALGLTQAEMGAKVGVDKMTVSRWERGALRPSKESLEALDGLRREAVRRGVVLAG
jgi:DNA-binding XRE family transcriptional regulator